MTAELFHFCRLAVLFEKLKLTSKLILLVMQQHTISSYTRFGPELSTELCLHLLILIIVFQGPQRKKDQKSYSSKIKRSNLTKSTRIPSAFVYRVKLEMHHRSPVTRPKCDLFCEAVAVYTPVACHLVQETFEPQYCRDESQEEPPCFP